MAEANLSMADIVGANFVEADLHKANCIGADFSGSKLMAADFHQADLNEAKLTGADIRDANFRNALLGRVDLIGAELVRTDLRKADLREATLLKADLREADITGANLYGTACDDWIIDGIVCKYVYWDKEWKERTPKNRDFRPGEFEECYRQLPTFEYHFEHGFTVFDAVLMNRVVQAVNARHPEFELKLDSFHSRGQPHAKFTVLHKNYIEEVRQEVKDGYEFRVKSLEGQMEKVQNLLFTLADQPKMLINNLTFSGGELTMGNKHIGRDSIEISGNAQVNQFTTGEGDSFQGDYAQKLLQSTTPQSSQKEITKLLSFIQGELPKLPLPDDTKEEVLHEIKGAEIQIKKDNPNKEKIAGKLKSATEALKEGAKTVKEAVMIGNLLGKAIGWCGEQWIEWMI